MAKKEVKKKSDKMNGFTKASLILAAVTYLLSILPLGLRGLCSLTGLILGIVGIKKYPSERKKARSSLGIIANALFVLLELVILVSFGPEAMIWGIRFV